MLHTRTGVGLVLASAGVVIIVGLPWLLRKRQSPDEYVVSEKPATRTSYEADKHAMYVPDKVATTTEIQKFDIMWSELESIQKKAGKLGQEEYKEQFLNSTMDYLQLDSEHKEEFTQATEKALQRLADARDRWAKATVKAIREGGAAANQSTNDSWSGESSESIAARRDAWNQWQEDQREISDLLLTVLERKPRHELLAERRLFWLLKLDFSQREARKRRMPITTHVKISEPDDVPPLPPVLDN